MNSFCIPASLNTDLKENQTLNMAAAQEAGLPLGENFTLANFSYVNSVVVERMFHHLRNPGFLGITVCTLKIVHVCSFMSQVIVIMSLCTTEG